MIWSLIRGAGRFALWLATMAFLCATALFVVGSYLLTWPLLRKSPRDKRIAAAVAFASAGMTVLSVFSENKMREMLEQELLGEQDGE